MARPTVHAAAPPPWLVPALAVLYLWPFPYFAALHSPNELSRLYQVRAIVEDGSLSVDGPLLRSGPVGDLSEVCPGHTRCEDPVGWYQRCTDGRSRCFPNKAPGLSLAGAAAYFPLRWVAGANLPDRTVLLWLRILLCALPTLALLHFLWPLCRDFAGDGVSATTALLGYALGTLAFTYSLLFFSHQPSAVLLFGAFLAARRERAALAGLLAASAILFEYTTAPAAILVALYAPRKLRFLAGAVAPLIVLAAYHTAAFGSPLRTGYAFNTSRIFQNWMDAGFMGLGKPSLRELALNLFGPRRGLFFYSPFLLLAIPGVFALPRRERLLTLGICAYYLLFAASFLRDAWGWSFGPRHLTPLVPFLAAPAAITLARFRRSTLGAAASSSLVVLSIGLVALASVSWPHLDDNLRGGLRSVTLPLLAEGRLSWNIFQLATGVLSPLTWIPWFIALLVALAASLPRTLRAGVLSLVLAGGGLCILRAGCPPSGPVDEAGLIWAHKVWEPGPSSHAGLKGRAGDPR